MKDPDYHIQGFTVGHIFKKILKIYKIVNSWFSSTGASNQLHVFQEPWESSLVNYSDLGTLQK